MGKITVKHYLNTNLKPYIINSESYYSIYALVTANRQNTKVKSKVFDEYYTSADFEEITNPNNVEDYNLLTDEVHTITNIVNMIINTFGDFDRGLFSAMYNHFDSVHGFDLGIPDSMELGDFYTKAFSLKENNASGLSLLTWFSPMGQNELENFIIEKDIDISKKPLYNKLALMGSFRVLKWIFQGSKKTSPLINKYYDYFELCDEYIEEICKEIQR